MEWKFNAGDVDELMLTDDVKESAAAAPKRSTSNAVAAQAVAEANALDVSHGAGTRRVVANFWQNFGKMLLVFGCIGTDFCKKIRVLQHFSKSTRLSS